MPELIAVAIDGTPAGQGALELAGRLAGKMGAGVCILCTIDAAYVFQARDAAVSLKDQTEYPAAAHEQHVAKGIVADALDEMQLLGVHACGTILAGNPAREIVDAAERNAATIIVMGHRHLSWFDRMLHPSVCWDVLEHSTRPVLVSMAE